MNIKEIRKLYKKINGGEVLRNYWKVGFFCFAIIQMLILGLSKKSLEIIRLSVQFKVQGKLRKKYKYVLDRCDKVNYDSYHKVQSNKVWFCWFQGIESAPALVQRCYESLQKNLTDKEIILLTLDNIFQYVDFPEHITRKWKKGIITNTHFSDLLRLELLIKHGGTWIDATVFCTGGDIPDYMFNSELFFYQKLKPGSNGSSLNISSWFISSSTNNKVLLITRELLYEYWLRNNSMIDYFLLHMFICIVCDKYPEERDKIVKFCNSIPHILLLEMFESYDPRKFNAMKQMTSFHKLSYKNDQQLMSKKGTYYDFIINRNEMLAQ